MSFFKTKVEKEMMQQMQREEQMQGIRVACEHCYVLKNNGEYEFYLYSKEGE